MNTITLPKECDPKKFANEQFHFTGNVNLGSLAYLGGHIKNADNDAYVELQFDRDDQDRSILSGFVTAEVEQTCQRCLESVSCSIHSEFLLAAVDSDEQARKLPRRLEAAMCQGNVLNLHDVIGEEILLSLPQEAKHLQNCTQSTPMEKLEAGVKSSPFDELAKLKEL